MSKEDEIRIAAVGKTGAGKSTVGNALIGDGSFIVGEFSDSETTQTTTKEGTWNGLKVKYADTPGLFDTKAGDCEVKEEIAKCVKQLSPGPHIFFYVINADGKFTEEDFKSFNEFARLYGDDVKEHTHIVFTHRKPRSNRKEHEKKYIEKAKTYLKTVLEKCTYRHSFIYQENGTDSKPDVDKFMELACRLKTANNNKHYDSKMYNQAVQQVEDQKKKEADEKAAKEKKEEELEDNLQKVKEENELLEIKREEDREKLLKLEKQRLEEKERYQILRLIDHLKQYRFTLRDYNKYTEKNTKEFSDALKKLTEDSESSRIRQVLCSGGNILTSTGGVMGALTGPVGFTVMVAPSVIGYLTSLYSDKSSKSVTEKANCISSDEERHMSNINRQEDKILDLLRNSVSERLKSDLFKIIDNTKILKSRIQTKLEYHRGMGEELWVVGHLAKSFILSYNSTHLTGMTINTGTGKTSEALVTASLKPVSDEAVITVAEKTTKTLTVETTKPMTTKATNLSKYLSSVKKITYGVGVFLDIKNISDNTTNYKEPEILKKVKVKIDECNKTQDMLMESMSEIDYVITELTSSYPGA